MNRNPTRNNYGMAPDEDRPELANAIEAKYANPAVGLFGALLLRLGDGGYQWKFAQVDTPGGFQYSDEGAGTCR